MTAQAAAIAQPRLALAFAGGSPIPGSGSTLGFRTGSTPRVAAQVRVSGAFMTLPPLNRAGNQSLLAPTFDADVAVGVLNGSSPAPTLSGIGSLDVVASLGVAPAVGGLSAVAGFGAGVRLGVLRESFTVPGITFSGMLRHIGSSQHGRSGFPDTMMFRLAPATDLSLRAVVSKRFMPLATSVGVGLDHVSSDVSIRTSSGTGAANSFAGHLAQTRPNAFLAFTWTSLVFSTTAELGWQKGGNGSAVLGSPSGQAPAPATGQEGLVGNGALFGTVAFRLTI